MKNGGGDDGETRFRDKYFQRIDQRDESGNEGCHIRVVSSVALGQRYIHSM